MTNLNQKSSQMADARFKDGRETPLAMLAQDVDDLAVISTLIQDAIAERKEMLYEPARQSFSLLLRRFRWEDQIGAERLQRQYERVQTVLMIRSALGVKAQGINLDDQELAFDLLNIAFDEGKILLTFAGDGQIAIAVECIDVVLKDVSRPYKARAKDAPNHPA